MGNQYRLVGLGNSQLLAGLSELVRQSNALTAQLLAHLVELEERLLHLELGFSSLFAYCVEALGMSEGTAGRRVAAARVCRRFPDVFERVGRGELHLCALCALAPHLSAENAGELFEACRGRTRRQIEGLLAARFPRPDVREQIRRLPARVQVPVVAVTAVEQVSPWSGSSALVLPALDSKVPTVGPNSAPMPAPAPALADAHRRALEPISAERFGVHFTADAELRELIERARALASHRLPKGELAGLMKLALASFVRQEEKRRFGIGSRPRRIKPETSSARSADRAAPPGGVSSAAAIEHPTLGARESRAVPLGKRGRYLAVAVRREAHQRDQGRCAFISAEGRRCDGRAFLEFDHVEPLSRFGAGDAGNIRLLCKAHNLLHARNCFGAQHIAAKVAAGRSRPRKTAGSSDQ
ncbi:MAG TPA: HNH endonuclease signature motif containing protein [Polyangiaceae bacterium]|nr:HNH endonuclease signature motif containing protein [Polyangiaceae bacterium]